MNGVTSIHSGVQPGHMVAFGEDAHDVAFYAGASVAARR